jgi:S1-C subfamily serine protease
MPQAAPAPPAAPAGLDDAPEAAVEAQRAGVEAERARANAERAKAQERQAETRLEAARQRLEAAASEVAQLSIQFGGGPPHAVIGAELSTENSPDGVRVVHVSPGGPADEAGMKAEDIIISVNGTEPKGEGGARRIVHAIQDAAPDTKLNIRVKRGGKPKDLVVTARAAPNQFFTQVSPQALYLSSPPATSPVYTYRELGIPTLSNLQLVTLTPGLGHYFGTDKGVLVVRAPTKSDFQLQDGDVILSIDGREPTSGAHATRILASYQPGEKVMLHIMRDRKPVNLEAKLPEPAWSDIRFQYQAPPPVDGPGSIRP